MINNKIYVNNELDWVNNKLMNELELANEYKKKGKLAKENKEYNLASKNFFDAARNFQQINQKYMHKYCEATAWYLKSFEYQKTIDGFWQIAQSLNNAITANNVALEYIKSEDKLYNKIIGNIRFQEGYKYKALANMEIKKSMSTNNEQKANLLRKAGCYDLCSARAKFELTNLISNDNLDESYNTDLAKYLENKCLYFYYRAKAEKELKNFTQALEIFIEALETINLSIHLNIKYKNEDQKITIENNQTNANKMQKKINKEIEELERKVTVEKIDENRPPDLRIVIKTTEGLVQNLYTPLFIYLKNDGFGMAKNITVDLIGYIEGEKIAGLKTLSKNSNHLLSMAIKPIESGNTMFKVITSYHDYADRKYEILDEVFINIAQANQKRDKGKVLFDIKQGD